MSAKSVQAYKPGKLAYLQKCSPVSPALARIAMRVVKALQKTGIDGRASSTTRNVSSSVQHVSQWR